MRFTRENAATYARLANQARKANRRDIAEAMAKRLRDLTPPNPSYQEIRLARVRAQLDKLDAWILSEKDPQKLDRLASAQAKLAEQERQLAGRPMPGSLKPVAKVTRGDEVELPSPREIMPSSDPVNSSPSPSPAPAPPEVSHVEQYGQESVELPTQRVVFEGGNEGEVMGGS